MFFHGYGLYWWRAEYNKRFTNEKKLRMMRRQHNLDSDIIYKPSAFRRFYDSLMLPIYLLMLPVLLFIHSLSPVPFNIGSLFLVACWYFLPFGQALYHSTKSGLATTRIFNSLLELEIRKHESNT